MKYCTPFWLYLYPWKIISDNVLTGFQVVPSEMADKLFEACGSDSFEKLDSTVKVTFFAYEYPSVLLKSSLHAGM